MNTRIGFSILSILAAAGFMAGATFAFFSDQATSTENIFGAGDLVMSLSNNNVDFTEGVSATIGESGMAPGDTFEGDLYIRNGGSVDADHVDLGFVNVVTEAASPPGDALSPNFASVLKVTELMWDHNGDGTADVNVLPGDCDNVLMGGNGNGICDLQDLEGRTATTNADIVDLEFADPQGNGHRLHIEGEFDATLATNANQGDSNNLTINVFMDQGPH